MANTNIGISNFVYSQSPFFVRNDHPNFIRFVEAYYEYLEQEGKTIERAKGFREALDIDKSIDLYTEKLYNQFLINIPQDIIADKNLVLKHAKEFYRARGTEKSIQFLMSILYDEDTFFYYPKRDILKASDGKWYQEKSLKVLDVQVNNVTDSGVFTAKNFTGRQIRGESSNATATVESVDVYYETGVIVKELKVSNQIRDFKAGERIRAKFEEEGFVKDISANVFSGIITRLDIVNRGNNYVIGTTANVESDTGSGALIIVSDVSKAAIKTISPLDGGAGFQNSNIILISGTGSGANANVALVNTDETIHPNSYNIIISLISAEANTKIGNNRYANLNSVVVDPANAYIANSMVYFKYANTGPIQRVVVLLGGNNYTGNITMTAVANTRIKNLGILGKMSIVHPGSNYVVGDEIEFLYDRFTTMGAGVGARGYVASVNATGAIESVKFKQIPGYYIGGSGYSMSNLPTANIISGTGTGGSVVVTALLGFGEKLVSVSDDIGAILKIDIISGGSGYATPPVINLKAFGSGTAQVDATIVQGVYTYPGRYLNDDGHVSSFNFLQDGKYYHNYSYVVRVRQSISKYRKALKDLIHPAGTSLFGEYINIDEGDTLNTQMSTTRTTGNTILRLTGYSITNNVITYSRNYHGLVANDQIYSEYYDGPETNVVNGILTVANVINANSYIVRLLSGNVSNAISGTGNVHAGLL